MENARTAVWRNPVDGRFYQGELYSGQLLDITQVQAVEAKVILEEVLGLARPAYNLRQITRVVRMPQLVMSVDVATKLVGSEKVPALAEADIASEAFTRVDFSLWKNVVHVVISDEARLKAAHDLLRLHTEDAARELARMENSQIAREAEAAPAVAGSDWGVDANNPFDDITPVLNAVWGNGYQPDFMAIHPDVWSDFITNPRVRDLVDAGIVSLGAQGGQFTLPGYPTVRVVVDYALTNTVAIVGSTQGPALILGEGPTEASRYRDEKRGYDAFLVRQWLQPKLVNGASVRKITGVHA